MRKEIVHKIQCHQSHPRSQQLFLMFLTQNLSSYLCASPFARPFSSHKTNQSQRNFAAKFPNDGTTSATNAECSPTLPFSTIHWLSRTRWVVTEQQRSPLVPHLSFLPHLLHLQVCSIQTETTSLLQDHHPGVTQTSTPVDFQWQTGETSCL